MDNDPLISAIAEAVDLRPDVLELRLHLAELLLDRGDYASAICHCGTALGQDSGSAVAIELLRRCVDELTVSVNGQTDRAPLGVGRPTEIEDGAHRESGTETPKRSFAATGSLGKVNVRQFNKVMTHAIDVDGLIWSFYPSREAAERGAALRRSQGHTVHIVEARPVTVKAYSTDGVGNAVGVSKGSAVGANSGSEARRNVVTALLAFGRSGMQEVAEKAPPSFAPTTEADQLLLDDPFAFLLGVLFDQSIPAERAWQAPYELRKRLGHLDPYRMADDLEGVRRAINTYPALHRFVEIMPKWVVAAARSVCERYNGDAANIWGDTPTAREVHMRLREFDGIGQKKAAMAIEILERDRGVPIRDMQGSDIAYDVHVRRVFLRTHLAEVDDLDHMVDVARRANPDRPGEIDLPAWQIGRTWCRAGIPWCQSCPLTDVCPKDIDAAAKVSGL